MRVEKRREEERRRQRLIVCTVQIDRGREFVAVGGVTRGLCMTVENVENVSMYSAVLHRGIIWETAGMSPVRTERYSSMGPTTNTSRSRGRGG